MYLNPVNIHKGYRRERDLRHLRRSAKSRRAGNSRSGRVEKFECGTKPDIFSLKVDGEARRKIGAWAEKTVFECNSCCPPPIRRRARATLAV